MTGLEVERNLAIPARNVERVLNVRTYTPLKPVYRRILEQITGDTLLDSTGHTSFYIYTGIYINLGGESNTQGDAPISEEHHINYYVEVIVPQGKESHVSASETDQKALAVEAIPAESTNGEKRKWKCCGCWIWIYLIVVIVIVICLIVMFILQCNFLKSLRIEYEAIREDLQKVEVKSENDAERNAMEMNELEMKLSKMGPLLDETELKRIEGIFNGTEIATRVVEDWTKSHENLYYLPVLVNTTYDVAEANCQSLRGHLGSKILRKVTTKKEVDFFGKHTNITKLWAGYRRDSVGSPWRWADGGKTNNNSLQWTDSEPRDETGYNCAAIITQQIELEKPTYIQSENCDNPLPYVCEIEPLSFL